MKKLLIASIFMIGTSGAFAWENPDQKTTCYFFSGNQLKSKSTCILSSGGGAGGMYTNIKVGKKTYLFETETMTEDYKTFYYPNGNLENKPKDIIDYSRNLKTFKVLKDYEINPNTQMLFCHKTKDGKLDICYP